MAEERTGREIEFASDGEEARGYLSLPASGRGPGVIVIQEWWGLVPHICDVCDRMAREGFVALAPDLYRGESTEDPDVASRLMMDLEIPRAARDLDAAVAALLNHDAVDGAKVGAMGFCMGGQLALFAATRNRRIGAVGDFYGIHPNVSLDLSGLEAAVLGILRRYGVPTASVVRSRRVPGNPTTNPDQLSSPSAMHNLFDTCVSFRCCATMRSRLSIGPWESWRVLRART